MAWPYQFVELDKAAKHARRQALDRYGIFAHGSFLGVLGALLLYRIGASLVRRWRRKQIVYDAVPGSPALKRERENASGSWAAAVQKTAWWLEDEVRFLGKSWGQRREFIFGTVWTLWLVFLCVHGTGNDYLHFTKRFGTIAVSQFPIQYVLALKKFNPVAAILHSSHEAVNRWHRVLGRIIYFVLSLHAVFYLNYFYQVGILSRRIFELVPALGIAAFFGMVLLNTTALSIIREYSYRVFFITHLIVAFALPPIVYFHHSTSGFYMAEALALFILDLALRKRGTFTVDASLARIPGSDLIKIVVPVPPERIAQFRESPGAHVYLNVPEASRPSSTSISGAPYVFEFLFNPFTIASVGDDATDLTLIARCRRGPMTRHLANLAFDDVAGTKIPLSVEGPYGCATHFPALAGVEFDQLLLVAGGVGASFILPLYRATMMENPGARVNVVWAVRQASDATWPTTDTSQSILDDDRVQLFLTGDIFDEAADAGGSSTGRNEIEMAQLPGRQSRHARDRDQRRPDLQKIVDDIFRQGGEERIAVLVCGPEEMASELRKHVSVWVRKGRKVFWHNESFAW